MQGREDCRERSFSKRASRLDYGVAAAESKVAKAIVLKFAKGLRVWKIEIRSNSD